MRKHLLFGLIIMTGFFSFFGCDKKNDSYETVDIYDGLRNHLFTLDPATVGIEQNTSYPVVWGILMETGRPEAVATLVALGDGTVSLYFSNGGGIIGLGGHEQPKLIAKQLINLSQTFIDNLSETQNYPLPKKGHIRFYFLTFSGIQTIEIPEKALDESKHDLSPLYFKTHELITAVRTTQQSKQDK